MVLTILYVLQPSQLKQAHDDFVEHQTKLIKTLSPSIIQNILSNNLSELHAVFENSILIHKNEWRYIELRDADKKLLYPIFAVVPELTDSIVSIKVSIEENNELFGYITLYTDWNKTKHDEQNKINQLNLFVIILTLFLGIFSFLIQTKLVYQPIVKLKNVTHQFSLGNYGIPLPKSSDDEVGLLTLSVGQMRNKIQSTIEKLIIEEKRQRAILESVPDAIITINSQGIIKSFNPSAEIIFQYDKSRVIGQSIKMLMPQTHAGEHDQYIADSIISAEAKIIGTQRELYGLKQDGTPFPIEVTLSSMVIEGETIFTGVLRDITERKKVDQLKSEFISTVSHELRTPLTAIKGALDIMTHGLNLDLPEQATTMLDVSNRNVERLLTLINDILDISKLESGELNFLLEEIEIEPFLANCVDLNQEYAKKNNTLYTLTHCDENIFINVDKDRLTQVMSNFLSNAAKYSPKNIDIEIFTVINQGRLRVSVKDYGQGIPEEFQDSVFEKFTQSSRGNTRQVGGTGLGLSISKMIIKNLGGSIGFDTEENVQTTFYFELPIV
ncbi:MAG: ATP-binding protein [Woeseiaceae bacterium]